MATTPDPFAQIDAARIERHRRLLEIWQDCPVEEVAADLVVLAQIVAFRAHQAAVLHAARLAHAGGATHDCYEWWKQGACAICGRLQS